MVPTDALVGGAHVRFCSRICFRNTSRMPGMLQSRTIEAFVIAETITRKPCSPSTVEAEISLEFAEIKKKVKLRVRSLQELFELKLRVVAIQVMDRKAHSGRLFGPTKHSALFSMRAKALARGMN